MMRYLLLTLICALLVSCANMPSGGLGTPEVIKARLLMSDMKHKRKTYTMTVYDKYNRPFWKWRVEYIGKKPIGKYDYVDKWKYENWDFFNIYEWRMFDAPVNVISDKSWFGTGGVRSVLSTKSEHNQTGQDQKTVEQVQAGATDNTVLSVESNEEYQGKLVKKNMGVRSDTAAAVLHQVKRFSYRGDVYEFDLPLRYTQIQTLMFN